MKIKKIFIIQDRLKELEAYAEYKKKEVYKKEILEGPLLKEYIVLIDGEEDAFFVEMFKNNTKSHNANRGNIYTMLGNLGDNIIATFSITFCLFTTHAKEYKTFQNFNCQCNFESSKLLEQKAVIDNVINTFIRTLKKRLYEYYNVNVKYIKNNI